MLGHGDYCIDLLTAKKLGLVVEGELLKNCGRQYYFRRAQPLLPVCYVLLTGIIFAAYFVDL